MQFEKEIKTQFFNRREKIVNEKVLIAGRYKKHDKIGSGGYIKKISEDFRVHARIVGNCLYFHIDRTDSNRFHNSYLSHKDKEFLKNEIKHLRKICRELNFYV